MFADVQVVGAVQTQSMEALLSQLAETAAQERALLEECGDLLSVAASLEVQTAAEWSGFEVVEAEEVRGRRSNCVYVGGWGLMGCEAVSSTACVIEESVGRVVCVGGF